MTTVEKSGLASGPGTNLTCSPPDGLTPSHGSVEMVGVNARQGKGHPRTRVTGASTGGWPAGSGYLRRCDRCSNFMNWRRVWHGWRCLGCGKDFFDARR